MFERGTVLSPISFARDTTSVADILLSPRKLPPPLSGANSSAAGKAASRHVDLQLF